MTKSDTTKKYRIGSIVTSIISFLLLFTPLLAFGIIAFVNGEPHQKFALGATLTSALILFIISIINKLHLRSILWVLLLGISFCLDNIRPLLICMAVTTITEEIIVAPIHRYCKERYTINAQIDRRL